MTTTALPPEALAAAPRAIVISQFDVLLGDIAEAKAKAADATFDYNTKEGNKAARSYIFNQRKLNARIESARTDAKAYALEYGRTVDSQAATLKEQVAALIKPHQDAIDAIAKAEADRVYEHRKVINMIKGMGSIQFGASSSMIARWLDEVKSADVDSLEEFTDEGKAALVDALRALEAAHAKAVADEAAAAEREWQQLEIDLAQAQARADAAEAALARRQAIDAARDQEEADKTVRAMYLEEMALAVGEDPEPPATMPAQLTQSGPVSPSAGPTYLARGRAAAIDTPAAGEVEGGYEAKRRLRMSLNVALVGKSRNQVTEALVAGTLHPAITVDWSKA